MNYFFSSQHIAIAEKQKPQEAKQASFWVAEVGLRSRMLVPDFLSLLVKHPE